MHVLFIVDVVMFFFIIVLCLYTVMAFAHWIVLFTGFKLGNIWTSIEFFNER